MMTTASTFYSSREFRPAIFGAFFGAIALAIPMGLTGILPGLIYGAILAQLISAQMRHWVDFDFKRISEYQAPTAPWTLPGHTFDNTVATENGDTVSQHKLASWGAAVLCVALVVLFCTIILNGDVPVVVSR